MILLALRMGRRSVRPIRVLAGAALGAGLAGIVRALRMTQRQEALLCLAPLTAELDQFEQQLKHQLLERKAYISELRRRRESYDARLRERRGK